MSIIIGGPPSSGSSLLATILNRHSQLACFQETHLLSKHQLYRDWDSHKSRLRKGRLFSPGWHMYNKINLPLLMKDDNSHINSSLTLCHFVSEYFSVVAQTNNKRIWAEKTPANVYFFHLIKKNMASAQFILTVRHPYDTIASLILRGKSILDAVALTLLNLGIGAVQSRRLDVLSLKYEDLVSNPVETCQKMCNTLHVEYEAKILEPENKPTIKMSGWKHHEDGHIQTSSLGRFSELSSDKQLVISHLAHKLFINPEHLLNYGIIDVKHSHKKINVVSLIEQFGYVPNELKMTASVNQPSLIPDRLKRLVRGHPTGFLYPVYYE